MRYDATLVSVSASTRNFLLIQLGVNEKRAACIAALIAISDSGAAQTNRPNTARDAGGIYRLGPFKVFMVFTTVMADSARPARFNWASRCRVQLDVLVSCLHSPLRHFQVPVELGLTFLDVALM